MPIDSLTASLSAEGPERFRAEQAMANAQAQNDAALRAAVLANDEPLPQVSDDYAQQMPGGVAWEDPDLARYVANYDAADDDAIRRNLGGGGAPVVPSQFDVGQAAGTVADMRGNAGDSYLEPLLATVTMPSRPNPVRPIREQYTGAMLGGQPTGEVDENGQPILSTGLLGEGKATNEAAVRAQTGESEAMASAYAQEAARQQAQIDIAEQKALRDNDRRQQYIDDTQAANDLISKSVDRLMKAPDIDPERYWASRTNGQKALWVVSAMLNGLAGLNPTEQLQSVINNDIDAQKANFAQGQARVGAAATKADASRSLYNDVRMAIGDENATAEIIRIARFEQAKAALMAQQIKAGIPVQVAQGNVFMIEMDQKIAEAKANLAERLAVTPRRIGGGTRPLVTGPIRKTLERLQDRDYDEAAKLRMKAIDLGGEAAGAAQKAQTELQKAEIEAGGKKAETERQHSFEQRKWVTEKVEPFQNELNLIEQFRNDYPNDIPGIAFGMEPTQITDDQKQAYERLKRIVMVRLRRESGAAISDKELSNDAAAILEAMDEDDVRNMLADREAEARRRIDYFQRAPDEPEVDQVNRSKSGPRAAIASGGAGIPDPVQWDR